MQTHHGRKTSIHSEWTRRELNPPTVHQLLVQPRREGNEEHKRRSGAEQPVSWRSCVSRPYHCRLYNSGTEEGTARVELDGKQQHPFSLKLYCSLFFIYVAQHAFIFRNLPKQARKALV